MLIAPRNSQDFACCWRATASARSRQRTMLGAIIERKRTVKMRSTFSKVSCEQQRDAHHAMPDHQRDCRPLFLGERKELRCVVATHITVEHK